MASRWTELCVDCSDPERLSRFWCDVLGWQEVGREDEAISIAAAPATHPTLTFVPVPEAKHVKNRLHIDVNPVGCDQDTELQRLLALGARHIDIGQGQQTWHVLADPEGNEFCLLRTRQD